MEVSRTALIKRGLRLEYFTVAWNVVEAVVAIGAGVVAGSVALVGFGLDSIIELTSGCVLIWRLRKHGVTSEEAESEAERKAIFVVGVTFFALAFYILYEAVGTLIGQEKPMESLVGIMLAAVSLMVMPYLGIAKRRVAARINSRALAADGLETLVCSYLSFTLLLGLGLNALFGWWWADPIAALAMLWLLVREGWEAVEEGWKRG